MQRAATEPGKAGAKYHTGIGTIRRIDNARIDSLLALLDHRCQHAGGNICHHRGVDRSAWTYRSVAIPLLKTTAGFAAQHLCRAMRAQDLLGSWRDTKHHANIKTDIQPHLIA